MPHMPNNMARSLKMSARTLMMHTSGKSIVRLLFAGEASRLMKVDMMKHRGLNVHALRKETDIRLQHRVTVEGCCGWHSWNTAGGQVVCNDKPMKRSCLFSRE